MSERESSAVAPPPDSAPPPAALPSPAAGALPPFPQIDAFPSVPTFRRHSEPLLTLLLSLERHVEAEREGGGVGAGLDHLT